MVSGKMGSLTLLYCDLSRIFVTFNSDLKMVRIYNKKTRREKWSKEIVKESVEEVLSNKIGYKKVVREYYCLPQTTLERHVEKLKQ